MRIARRRILSRRLIVSRIFYKARYGKETKVVIAADNLYDDALRSLQWTRRNVNTATQTSRRWLHSREETRGIVLKSTAFIVRLPGRSVCHNSVSKGPIYKFDLTSPPCWPEVLCAKELVSEELSESGDAKRTRSRLAVLAENRSAIISVRIDRSHESTASGQNQGGTKRSMTLNKL